MVILYVADQSKSCQFYEAVLQQKPLLNVPGMTEFKLTENFLLGLMPETGIANIICPSTPHPEQGNGIPRCELYLVVEDPDKYLNRAVANGAKLISPTEERDWGDWVGYCADPDGHIIAFAK